MNFKRTITWKLFLLPLFTMLFGMVLGGCSDDKEELQGSQYGYVQFKLYKAASYQPEGMTRANLDKLGAAQKVEVEMQYNGTSITQTLVLNAYNESNAEYGMRSDKLQLLVGDYKIVGYKLLDKLDEVITSVSVTSEEVFTVISRGLTVKDLTVDVQSRGTVTFKLAKTGLPTTRATGDSYLFSDINLIDVTVKNTFTQNTTTFKKLKVTYKEEYKENQNPDNPNDKYMDIGVATCDSAVWLPTGDYRVTGYTVYRKSGAVVTTLESNGSVSGEEFTIEDNKLTEHANVPILLSETKEYIKDYLALRAIWEAMDGKNWKYYGAGEVAGANWNFNKEMDMWGDQPGVTLNKEGRVVGLSLEGFGARGVLPDAIGQLTELKMLALGSHSEKLGRKLFEDWNPDMSGAQQKKLRMDYSETFLNYDPRESLSEMIQHSINTNPAEKPIVKSKRVSRETYNEQIAGKLSNEITGISKAVMRLKKLQLFYIGNSPIKADDICENWADENSEYAQKYKDESLEWINMKELTDIEVYNCPELDRVPEFLFKLPELQLLNLASNTGISGKQLKDDWTLLATGNSGKKLQILYLSYNNLEEFPEHNALANMKKMGMLDCYSNKIHTVHHFGKEVKLVQLILSNNLIEVIPDEFCGFTSDVETLNFSNNRLKYIPNIFDASSVQVMGSVDFSNNLIGSDGGKNVKDADAFKGINASTISLAYNRISKFPTELFRTGSPISTINLSNNLLETIPENSLKDKNGNFKNTYLLTSIDLRFNQLRSLSDDFRATTLPYLANMDVSYNRFSKFPTEPLNSSQLRAFGIRHQRDDKGNRILREWPEGISSCPSLLQLQTGANDIRKVEEKINPRMWILEIKDNPNISLDVTHLCPYIQAGMYMLVYDKTQDIRGCDILKQ